MGAVIIHNSGNRGNYRRGGRSSSSRRVTRGRVEMVGVTVSCPGPGIFR